MKYFVIFLWLLGTIPASAAVFRTSYVSFELPERWRCSSEGTEWICRSASKGEQKEALIILTGKEAGPTDSMELFTRNLRQPRSYERKPGSTLQSQVQYTKPVKINDVTWVDSLHISSELPNFYTRYLVTVKSGVAILVTFSSHQSVYTRYVSDFFSAVNSLRIIDAPLPSRAQSGGSQGGIIGPATGEFSLDPGMADYDNPQHSKNSSGKSLLLALGIILLGAGAYLWLRSQKKHR